MLRERNHEICTRQKIRSPPSKDIQVLIPPEYANLYGKRDSEDMILSRDFELERPT